MSKARTYRVVLTTTSVLIDRTVTFDGERITAAKRDGQPHELAPDYRAAIEAVLKTHEGSGFAGTALAIEIEPEEQPA